MHDISLLFAILLLVATSHVDCQQNTRCHCVPVNASGTETDHWIIKPFSHLYADQELQLTLQSWPNLTGFEKCCQFDRYYLNHTEAVAHFSVSETITSSDPASCLKWNSLFPKNVIRAAAAASGEKPGKKKPKQMHVWLASTIASLIISSVGLMGVAVVPLIQKMFFNQVIQYLVAVAVGTLIGDVFLHQVPHALGSTHSHDEAESGANFRGLMSLGGIYFFFLAEKLVAIISEHRAEKTLKEEELKRRKSLDVRATSIHPIDDAINPLRRPSRQMLPLPPDACKRTSRAMSIVDDNIMTTGLTSRAMKNIEQLYRYTTDDGEEEDTKESESPEKVSENMEVTIKVPGPEDKRHSHDSQHSHKAHGHGHSHEMPESIAAVAWMVIMGDGLHNFTDGMAIGVAFAGGIAGGISTTVAIFCHELPHELGDFAVLLKTGMKIKHALMFNVLSSVLSFLGMVLGIALGNVESAQKWIIMFTAGTFIYISLVDMLPELNTSEVKLGESRLLQFVIQNAGLFSGVGIMFLIAYFEDNIKNSLTFET
ncbi:hypothetical protein Ciccas_009468 [Cichlidogyrus casuarinus]|uniref:Zinc transporter ZIP10 n=1 Tax=Cichlidogyrus casuarinus TaxID=1844966 RepID=A0ABD2Q1F3_9PLAT